MKNNFEVLRTIKKHYPSFAFRFSLLNKSLHLKGEQGLIDKIQEKISSLLMDINESEMDLCCNLCWGKYAQPFILLNCKHKFCAECLRHVLYSAIDDMNYIPIKCPQC